MKNKVATKAATGAGALDVRSIKALATCLPQYRCAVTRPDRDIMSAHKFGQGFCTIDQTHVGRRKAPERKWCLGDIHP